MWAWSSDYAGHRDTFTVNELRRVFGVVHLPGAGCGNERAHAPVRELIGTQVSLPVSSGIVRVAGVVLQHLTGQARVNPEFGRIGFMSTQRRESRWRRIGCAEGKGASGRFYPALAAPVDRTNASGATAPPGFLVRLAPE